MRRIRARRLLLRAFTTVAVLCASGPALASSPPTPPGPPATGELGGNGPCGTAERVLPSGARTSLGQPLDVYVLTPTGAAATPLVGGACDSDTRPVVFFSHGYGLGKPSDYAALVTHWVSNGNVVVMADYESGNMDLETTFRQVDQGNRAAVAAEPRIDVTRTGFYGYSHGGGMTAYLAQQAVARGWSSRALWLTSLSQAYTQFQGTGGPIRLPGHARAFVIAGDNDGFADARNGIDVFESLTLDGSRKDHITLHSDDHGSPALDASHAIVTDGSSPVDALDFALWRLSDVLQSCSLRARNCDADLASMGTWSDGTPVTPATVTDQPVDTGPVPAVLAECQGPFALLLNPRIGECGPSVR
jgi:dienelactone hydrolase